VTSEPTGQTTYNSDGSPADGSQGDHAEQHQCEHHHGCTALPIAVGPCVHKSGDADQKSNREEDSAGPGEPEPMPEPSPIASDSRDA
jgi:hypothetical protein